MIFDKLANIGAYKGISKNLDTAIHFIETHDLEALPLGRTEIDGANVFLNKMEANAIAPEKGRFEMHKKYMDIQIDVKGTERVETCDKNGYVCEDFNEDSDIGFGDNPVVASCTLGPGNFTICMAEEPHKPGIQTSEDTALVKCVLKVRA